MTLIGLVVLAFAPSFGLLLFGASLIGIGSAIFHPESSRVARLASGGHVNFDAGTVKIEQRVWHQEIGKPKSEGSRRTLGLGIWWTGIARKPTRTARARTNSSSSRSGHPESRCGIQEFGMHCTKRHRRKDATLRGSGPVHSAART